MLRVLLFAAIILIVRTVLGLSVPRLPASQPWCRGIQRRSQKVLFNSNNNDDKKTIDASFPVSVFTAMGRSKRDDFLKRMKKETPLLEIMSNVATELPEPKDVCGITTIRINSPDFKFPCDVSPHLLFKRCFADDLLNEIGTTRKDGIILVGSAGTSKSMFQYVLLHHIMTNVSATVRGIRPQIIIRQKGNSLLVHSVLTKQTFSGMVPADLISLFDPQATIFLYEPEYLTTPPLTSNPRLPTVMTVSPNPERYYEFDKQTRAAMFYMPKYSLPELLYIGAKMVDDDDNKHKKPMLEKLYSEEQIKERYKKYGGIIRRVLPTDSESEDKFEQQRKDALSATAAKVTENFRDVNRVSNIGSYWVQWSAQKARKNMTDDSTTDDVASENFEPIKWKWAFRKQEVDWASPLAKLDLGIRN